MTHIHQKITSDFTSDPYLLTLGIPMTYNHLLELLTYIS